MRQGVAVLCLALAGCFTLPPKFDPEGCDHMSDSAKRAGSDLVVDGDLYCATDDGDCELAPVRAVKGKPPSRLGAPRIPIHILRKEAEDHHRRLIEENAISFCFPPSLWYPSEGRYRGRFYLRQESDRRYHMAFYPLERRY